MQDLFYEAVKDIRVRCSFRAIRGELRAELLKASTNCDMLVVSHSRYEFGPRLNVRARLQELLQTGPPTLIFVQERWQTGHDIAVLFDGSAQCSAALRIAGSIADAENLKLIVWLPIKSDNDYQQLKKDVETSLINVRAAHSISTVNCDSPDDLVRATKNFNLRALVVPNTGTPESRDLIGKLLDKVACSIIIAR